MTTASDARLLLAGVRPEVRGWLAAAAVPLLLGVALLAVLMQPETSLTLLAGALAAAAFVAKPHWGILVMLVFVVLRSSVLRIGPASTAELIGAVLLIPLSLRLLRDRGVWAWRAPEVRLLIGIAGVFLAATTWSVMRHVPPPVEIADATWTEPFSFFQFLLMFLYFIVFIRTPRHLAYAAVVVLALILVLAGDSLKLLEGGPGTQRAQAATFGGFAGNENRLAFLCIWGTAFFWALRFRGPKGWWRPLTSVPLLVLPVATLATGSRSGLLQLVLLGALLVLEQRHWAAAQRVRTLALIAATSLLALVAVPEVQRGRAVSFDVSGPTTIGRVHTVEAAAVMLAEHPIFGVGPGNFAWRNFIMTGHFMGTHNSYLWALTSGGPLLLLLYLVLFHRTYRTLRDIERRGAGDFGWLATALRVNLIIFLVFSFFANIWLAEVFWILIALTVVLRRVGIARPVPSTGRL
ncbi:MAG TPA: O-antigen ligase family protein [Candidatus Binatia bacterium]|nr:O-antigen ligase family protein [Candidatus Binatia bacterium]